MSLTFQVEERHSASYEIQRCHFTQEQWSKLVAMECGEQRAEYLRECNLLSHAEYMDNTSQLNERDDSTISSIRLNE